MQPEFHSVSSFKLAHLRQLALEATWQRYIDARLDAERENARADMREILADTRAAAS